MNLIIVFSILSLRGERREDVQPLHSQPLHSAGRLTARSSRVAGRVPAPSGPHHRLDGGTSDVRCGHSYEVNGKPFKELVKIAHPLKALLESLKAKYPTASADELTDRFIEELRSDEELHKTVLEEVFRLMATGLERTWPKNE